MLIGICWLYWALLLFESKVRFKTVKMSGAAWIDSITGFYREVQLLFQRYNEIHKGDMIPLYILASISSFCVGTYPVITKYKELDIVSIFIGGNIWATSLILMRTCFYVPILVYGKSSFLTSGKNFMLASKNLNGSAGSAKMLRKYWKSFPPAKIFFFSSNFFEGKTPLVILDFAINVTVNMILIDEQ